MDQLTNQAARDNILEICYSKIGYQKVNYKANWKIQQRIMEKRRAVNKVGTNYEIRLPYNTREANET